MIAFGAATSHSGSGPDLLSKWQFSPQLYRERPQVKKYITVRFSSRSDRGRIRPGNEDALLADGETGLFAVADGMGGHAAGEVASRVAIEALRSAAQNAPGETGPSASTNARKWLASSVEAANRAVYEAARADPRLGGMGTTLTALYIHPPIACYAHVGDSRMYRLRGGRLQQITRDHTWVQEQVDAGLLSPAQAAVHPQRSVLTRAVGTSDAVAVESADLGAEPGDLFLLASDGLTGMLTDDQIAAVLMNGTSLDGIADDLIREANARGGVDNITVVLVRLDPE